LAGFFAVPTGVLATIRTAAIAPDLMGARFSFERLNDPPQQGDLVAAAEIVQRPGTRVRASVGRLRPSRSTRRRARLGTAQRLNVNRAHSGPL
jgi:hypothetical protein